MMRLADLSLKAQVKHHNPVVETSQDNTTGYQYLRFENNDELVLYNFGDTVIKPLDEATKTGYVTYVFFDSALPDSAIRASIEQLGLKRYVFNFGYCSEEDGKCG